MSTVVQQTSEELRSRLEALEAEQAGLRKKLTAAAAAGDEQAFTQLASRQAMLPTQIDVMREQLQVQELREEIAVHEATIARSSAEIARLQPRYEELTSEMSRIHKEHSELAAKLHSLSQD